MQQLPGKPEQPVPRIREIDESFLSNGLDTGCLVKRLQGRVHTAYGAPRSQTTATRAREVEAHEHMKPYGDKAPPPGTRRDVLPELGPQRS